MASILDIVDTLDALPLPPFPSWYTAEVIYCKEIGKLMAWRDDKQAWVAEAMSMSPKPEDELNDRRGAILEQRKRNKNG